MTPTEQEQLTEQQPAETPHVSGKRPGGQPGNVNRQRHGLRSNKPPKGCRDIERDSWEFRRSAEQAVTSTKGIISVVDACTINRAVRSEVRARLCARWLEKGGDELTFTERLNCVRDIDNATRERDRAISDLGIEARRLASLWSLTDAQGGEA